MREQIRDKERLEHIRKAIFDIEMAMDKYMKEEINNDPVLFYGVVKMMEIIGEVSYMLTTEFKETHPEISWKEIVGMRHILVHGYYQISENRLWCAIHHDIPILKAQIERCINEIEENS